jgi:hypothetical protein
MLFDFVPSLSRRGIVGGGSMLRVDVSQDGGNQRAAVGEADPAFRLFKTVPVDSKAR